MLLSSEENMCAAFYWIIKQCKFICILSMSVFCVPSLLSYVYDGCLVSFCERGSKLEGCRELLTSSEDAVLELCFQVLYANGYSCCFSFPCILPIVLAC